jgi:hypothetical protein
MGFGRLAAGSAGGLVVRIEQRGFEGRQAQVAPKFWREAVAKVVDQIPADEDPP